MSPIPVLPLEITEWIATSLDSRTLLTFRLASLQFRVASEKAFLGCYFTKRVHLYTTRSLRHLLEICRRPQLVKRLTSIEIVQPDNGVRRQEPYQRCYGPPGNIAWKPWIQASQAINEDDSTLREIFHHLKSNGITPRLSVRSSAEPNEDRPYGIKVFLQRWEPGVEAEVSEDTLLHRHQLCDLASYRLTKAIADSGFGLTSLVLGEISDPSTSTQQSGNDIQVYSDSFFRALRSLTSLKSISFLFGKDPSDGHDGQPLSLIVKALEPLPLSTISLRHLSGSAETFVALLNQHERTLRQVCFEDIGMFDADNTAVEWPWERVLFRMRSMQELQQAKLKYLCTVVEGYTILRLRDDQGHSGWMFQNLDGVNGIASGITGILDHQEQAIILERRD
jgi:hypothetical protein